MKNRLFRQQLLLSIYCFSCIFCFSNLLSAQNINYTYTGPDSLFMDTNCQTVLNWGDPGTIDFISADDILVDTFYIHEISGGFSVGDTVVGTQTIFISYVVKDSVGLGMVLDSVVRLSLVDTIPPDIISTATDTIVDCDPNGVLFLDWLSKNANASAVDACSSSDNGSLNSTSWSVTRIDTINSECGDTLSYQTLFQVTDQSGNASYTSATFQLIDTIAPVISGLISDFTELCGGNNDGNRVEQWFKAAKDSQFADPCNGGALSFVEVNYTGRDGFTGRWTSLAFPFPNFIPDHDCTWYLDAEFVFEDACGRIGKDTARFYLNDTLAPDLINIPPDTVVFCDQIPEIPTEVRAIDNCAEAPDLSVMEVIDTIIGAVLITRTWQATDDCGNSGTGVQVITVTDTIAPELMNIPQDTLVTCTDIPFTPLILTAEDNCTDNTAIVFEFFESSDQDTHPDSCRTYSYTITRSWVAIDLFNNADTQSQIITVVDTVAPVFSVPPAITVSCEWRDSLPVTGQPIAISDNCDPSPEFSFVDLVIGGDCFGLGVVDTIMRTWIVEDACGNRNQAIQTIILIDTTPPAIMGLMKDTFIQCLGGELNLPVPETGIIAQDNCTSSPIIQYLGEVSSQGTNPDSCNFNVFTIQRSWQATDACGNSSVFEQKISIIDTLPPDIFCPDNMTVNNLEGSCEGVVSLPMPLHFDACTGLTGRDTLSLEEVFTSGPGDVNSVPVDTMFFDFNLGDIPPGMISGDLSLTIHLNKVDGEGQNETFSIIGEDGTVFANTNTSLSQCGNSTTRLTIDAATANEYAGDGVITFVLGPNGLDSEAINNICTDGTANVIIEYDFEVPSSLVTVSYKIDDGLISTMTGAVDTLLGEGVHQVVYYARDCSGNIDSCHFEVSVLDTEKPVLDCPPTIIAYVDSSGCESITSLPFPADIRDNCNPFSTEELTQTEFLKFGMDDNAGQVPEIISVIFSPEKKKAAGEGSLIVSFLGDNNNEGEFFKIYGENGLLLGQTSIQSEKGDECAMSVNTIFNLPGDSLTAWASDGRVEISAIPNKDVTNFSDFINPCDSNVNSAGSDGNSQLIFQLSFPTQVITYTILDKNQETKASGILEDSTLMVVEKLGLGSNVVTYSVEDASGNIGSCQFTIEVRDTLPPEVECRDDFTVFTNLSGIITDLNQIADSLISGMEDNCFIASISASGNEITCMESGTDSVLVTVLDSFGNSASCIAEIQIAIEELEPSFSIGICNNDALYLLADTSIQAPTGESDNFSYAWTGPNNFTSSEANPVIPDVGVDNSGIYELSVTGSTGCMATGSIFVNINRVDAPLINALSTTVCEEEGITLTTSAANCNELVYQWYEIISREAPLEDTVVLAGATNNPRFTINNPTQGLHSYYLIVQCDDCSSLSSDVLTITVFGIPEALTSEPVVNICEGETIHLSTPLTDPTLIYAWTGPGFISDLPVPAPIENSTTSNEGVYTLSVSRNGCVSREAFTIVNVIDKPAKPSIAYDQVSVTCEGDSLLMKSNILNANLYTWTNNTTFDSFITTVPEFKIEGVSVEDAGNWSLIIEKGTCVSDSSDPVTVTVESRPDGQPYFEGPACSGKNVQLNVSPLIESLGYEWKDLDGNIFPGPNPEVRVQSAFNLTITSLNGCQTRELLTINVQETPVITTIFDSGDADPCIVPENTDVQIYADVFPENDGSYTFQWTTPDGLALPPVADSILLIPNTSASEVNGLYTLVVNNSAGCSSDPVTNIVALSDVPLPNPIISANSTDLCEGQSLILSATEYSNFSAEYHWRIPSVTDTVTFSPVLVLDAVTVAMNGVVTVDVYNGNCPSVNSSSLSLSVSTPLSQPLIEPLPVLCVGDQVVLKTTEVSDASYLWEGSNFTATSSSAEIVIEQNASEGNLGDYTVQVISRGCKSPKSVPVSVLINPVPTAPQIGNGGDNCLDNLTDIILFIEQDTFPEGVTFKWYEAESGDLVSGPDTPKFQIIETEGMIPGLYTYYATTVFDQCESPASNTTQLTVSKIPDEFARVCEPNTVICDPDNAFICADIPQQSTGTWSISDPAVTIVSPNQPVSKVEGMRPGGNYNFVWTLSSGVCGDFSSAELDVRVGVAASVAKTCDALISICEGNSISLCANPIPSGFLGRWTQPENQKDLGVVIDNAQNSNTTVSSIEAGVPYKDYMFFWEVMDEEGLCMAVDTIQVDLWAIPDEEAVIEDESLITCNGSAVVAALSISDGLKGEWTSPDTNIEFENPVSNNTFVQQLQPGANLLSWHLSAGACLNYSSDEITVFYEEAPVAIEDEFNIGFSSTAILDVVANDKIYSPEYDITILSTPMNGSVQVLADGSIEYQARKDFVGNDVFTYELCTPTCGSECTVGTVRLLVGDDADCQIPTIMTPNGDNINDTFFIPCVETGNFPANEVIIFNQWGDEVFRAAPYANDWRGTYNGEDLPSGTYYYVIAFDRNVKPSAGFLIIER